MVRILINILSTGYSIDKLIEPLSGLHILKLADKKLNITEGIESVILKFANNVFVRSFPSLGIIQYSLICYSAIVILFT